MSRGWTDAQLANERGRLGSRALSGADTERDRTRVADIDRYDSLSG